MYWSQAVSTLPIWGHVKIPNTIDNSMSKIHMKSWTNPRKHRLFTMVNDMSKRQYFICKKILPGDWLVNVAQSSTNSLIPLLRWAKTFDILALVAKISSGVHNGERCQKTILKSRIMIPRKLRVSTMVNGVKRDNFEICKKISYQGIDS